MLHGGDFIGRGDEGVGEIRVELAEVAIGDRASRLQMPERVTDFRRQGSLGDGEIGDGAGGGGALQRVGRHGHLAHAVAFGAGGGHVSIVRASPLSARGGLEARDVQQFASLATLERFLSYCSIRPRGNPHRLQLLRYAGQGCPQAGHGREVDEASRFASASRSIGFALDGCADSPRACFDRQSSSVVFGPRNSA